MKNSWNSCWTDYTNLISESLRFCRKHWIDMLVFLAIYVPCTTALYLGLPDELFEGIIAGYELVKTKITSVFKKGEHEKE